MNISNSTVFSPLSLSSAPPPIPPPSSPFFSIYFDIRNKGISVRNSHLGSPSFPFLSTSLALALSSLSLALWSQLSSFLAFQLYPLDPQLKLQLSYTSFKGYHMLGPSFQLKAYGQILLCCRQKHFLKKFYVNTKELLRVRIQ